MWTIAFVSIALAAAFIVLLTRTHIAARKRSAKWDDLRARGRLFTSQLEHLREISASKPPPLPAETKVRALRPAGKSRSFWPRPALPQRPEPDTAPQSPLPSQKIA
jgi:hypothetical protein